MSIICRTGYLASTPKLRHDGEGRPYTFARVIVTDRVKTDSGWEDGATIGYDVAVNGRQAVGLVEAAEASGNIRVMFEGEYRVRRNAPEGGEPRDIHEVRGATVGASFAGQKVVIEKREGDAAPADDDTPF